jgi:hypothetical protein
MLSFMTRRIGQCDSLLLRSHTQRQREDPQVSVKLGVLDLFGSPMRRWLSWQGFYVSNLNGVGEPTISLVLQFGISLSARRSPESDVNWVKIKPDGVGWHGSCDPNRIGMDEFMEASHIEMRPAAMLGVSGLLGHLLRHETGCYQSWLN